MALASTVAASILLAAALAFAQQAQTPASPKTEQPMGAMDGKMGMAKDKKMDAGMNMPGGGMDKMGGGMCMSGKGMGMGMGMMNIPPEKREAVMKIKDEYKDKLFNLHQDLRAKTAELNAIMLQAQPDTAKAKAVAKEIDALKTQETETTIDMHARISKETGVRLPIMPMGMMGE
jgi:Spy/CpxP family protein refolding chaperone